ncbi:MAG: hypothetical protein QXI58_01280 [Candidatus Micrarchaeia archaeon]
MKTELLLESIINKLESASQDLELVEKQASKKGINVFIIEEIRDLIEQALDKLDELFDEIR